MKIQTKWIKEQKKKQKVEQKKSETKRKTYSGLMLQSVFNVSSSDDDYNSLLQHQIRSRRRKE